MATQAAIEQISTDNLWMQTHTALCAGEWSRARRLLDDLGRRTDVVDRLLHLSQYQRMCDKLLVSGFSAILQDRIDLVNDKIG